MKKFAQIIILSLLVFSSVNAEKRDVELQNLFKELKNSDNTKAVEIENNAIQELQFISGTFNAEYGQAMSGIVNIVTKDGDYSKYLGSLSGSLGDYFISSDRALRYLAFANDKSVEVASPNLNLSLVA